MKIKFIYILDLIMIVATTFMIPEILYRIGIHNTKFVILGTLIWFWFYVYIYRDVLKVDKE